MTKPQPARYGIRGRRARQEGTEKSAGINWLKDLAFPLITAILGFALGIAGEILKPELAKTMSSPEVRYREHNGTEDQTPKTFKRNFSTTLHLLRHSLTQPIIITALSRPGISIEPDWIYPTDPQMVRSKDPAQKDSKVTLDITALSERQSYTWTVPVKSNQPIPTDGLIFEYSPKDKFQDDQHLSWYNRVSFFGLIIGLIVYSSLSTLVAFWLYLKLRGQHK